MPTPYTKQFYNNLDAKSYHAARIYVDLLKPVIQPVSVMDVGCGTGQWLRAFIESGCPKAAGVDGDWIRQEDMADQAINFIPHDLNIPFVYYMSDVQRFDLVMSLEVAEHCEPASAGTFVQTLVDQSDLVMFSAAYTGQGGTNHINEQPHTYWADMFSDHGYYPVDYFRPKVWGDRSIPFWYRQNTFLYVKIDTPTYRRLIARDMHPMQNTGFMNCLIPPDLK